jgi:phage FluMu protein Com
MIVSDEMNHRVANELATQIDKLLDADPDLTQREIFTACLMVMCGALASIDCPDCRRINARMLKKELPHMIKAALQHETGVSGGEHVH